MTHHALRVSMVHSYPPSPLDTSGRVLAKTEDGSVVVEYRIPYVGATMLPYVEGLVIGTTDDVKGTVTIFPEFKQALNDDTTVYYQNKPFGYQSGILSGQSFYLEKKANPAGRKGKSKYTRLKKRK